MDHPFQIREASWSSDRASLFAVRHRVFVEEQKVPEEIEVDEHDASALHVLALDGDGHPIGTARLLIPEKGALSSDAKIGRVAVLPHWRRSGVGSALMDCLLTLAREKGISRIILHAQLSSIPFYSSLGFQTRGEVFEEANIPHREMLLEYPI